MHGERISEARKKEDFMSDLEQRVKALETKVKILEETLETLKNMQLSEQMDEYIQSKSKSLKLVNLILQNIL